MVAQGVVIMGHSTGCQSAVRYVQRYAADRSAARLLGVVLQAPVRGAADVMLAERESGHASDIHGGVLMHCPHDTVLRSLLEQVPGASVWPASVGLMWCLCPVLV